MPQHKFATAMKRKFALTFGSGEEQNVGHKGAVYAYRVRKKTKEDEAELHIGRCFGRHRQDYAEKVDEQESTAGGKAEGMAAFLCPGTDLQRIRQERKVRTARQEEEPAGNDRFRARSHDCTCGALPQT